MVFCMLIQISAEEKAESLHQLKTSRCAMSESEVELCDYYKVASTI